MLVKIRSSAAAHEDKRDVLDEMLGCHVRIRHFTRIAGLLAGAAPADVGDGAAAVHRYFSLALPLHAADEDRSFAPRLVAAAPSREVLDALDEMTREHEVIEATLAELAPMWSGLFVDPSTQAARAGALQAGAARLLALFEPHLEKEERVLFPAARLALSPADLAALHAEMIHRRATLAAG